MRTTLLALLLTLPTLAATTAPSTDPSGPRAALLLYDKLVGPNDTDKALGLSHATTTRERALAQSLATVDGALANLHAQAEKKFDRATADDLVRTLDAVTPDDINAAKIEVTGDTAAVTFPTSQSPTTMIRVAGEWKISVKALVQNLKSNPRTFRKSLAKVAAAANDIATKIQDGQFTTPEAAKKQLESAYRTAFSRPDDQ
jgi:hypothetical protein